MTTNLRLETIDGWVQVDFDVISNIGGHAAEIALNIEKPLDTVLGHLLYPNKKLSQSELPEGTVWARAPYGRTILTITDDEATIYINDGNGNYLVDEFGVNITEG